MIRHNLGSKIIALLAALALSWFVSMERNPEARRIITVPLQIRYLQKGFNAECSINTINITLEGAKVDVENIRQEDISAWVDVSQINIQGDSGLKELRVFTEIIGSADNNLHFSASPSRVKVKLESMASKSMLVEIKYLTAPPAGYAFNNPQVEPSSVMITGRNRLVSSVKRVVLALNTVPKSGFLSENFAITPVDINGSEVKGVKMQPEKVKLKIQTVEVPASKEVPVSPLLVDAPNGQFKVAKFVVNPSSVTIQGRPQELAKVSTLETEKISINQAEKTFSKDVSIKVPDGVTISSSSKSKVKVTVYIEKQVN